MIHHIWKFCGNNLTTKFRRCVFFVLGLCAIPYIYFKNGEKVDSVQFEEKWRDYMYPMS